MKGGKEWASCCMAVDCALGLSYSDTYVIVSLWSLCGISLIVSQLGGAIYNYGGDFTFEGSATFTSCSAVASSSSDDAYAVSGGE